MKDLDKPFVIQFDAQYSRNVSNLNPSTDQPGLEGQQNSPNFNSDDNGFDRRIVSVIDGGSSVLICLQIDGGSTDYEYFIMVLQIIYMFLSFFYI